MRFAVMLLLVSCAADSDPNRPDIHGHPSDPDFCVNVEADGRKYTADDAPPTAAQAAAGVRQGSYPYPARCLADL